jgi:hypothetical protein
VPVFEQKIFSFEMIVIVNYGASNSAEVAESLVKFTATKFKNGTDQVILEGIFSAKMKKDSILFNGIDSESKFYFNHSFFLPVG